jgi:aminopeptidase N
MQNIFVELNYAIDACEYWFGPYAWDRVGYIMTTDGALEIAENIAYPSSMVNASLAANGRLFTHELGHHWWGDVVTLAEHNHMWIKEGPAEYSAHLFVEFKDGEDAFIETVKDNLEYVLNEAHIDDNGYQQLSPIPDSQIYGRHTYYKGAAVLHNLRGYLGDELFRQAMTGVQENYAYTSFYPDEFKEALEDQSGADLDPYFDAWIYQPGYSVFVADGYTINESAGTIDIDIQQKLHEANSYHEEVPLHIGIVDQSWNTEDHLVTVGGQQDQVTIDTDAESVEMVILNHGNKLNQARLDYTVRLNEIEPFNQQLPWVNFRLEKEEMTDSALVRIEHVWAAPDEMLGEEVWEISDRHYWKVDGIFPEEYWLAGRIMYDGITSEDLDYNIVGVDEEDVVLVYRPSPSENFEVYSDYTLLAGSLTSSTGTIKIDRLLPGEYAIANGDPSVNIESQAADVAFALYPNPAQYELTIQGYVQEAQQVQIQFLDQAGRLIKSLSRVLNTGEFLLTEDIQDLKNGQYVMSIVGEEGELLDSTGFQVRR